MNHTVTFIISYGKVLIDAALLTKGVCVCGVWYVCMWRFTVEFSI